MEQLTKENYFELLSKEGLELSKKGKFSYSSWADVWGYLKKNVPDARYEWCENNEGGLGFVDNYGCFAKVKVWSKELDVEVTQHLHAMDFNNKAVQKSALTATEINKAYQRCLVKAIATGFGLGLYIFRGEDFPEDTDGNNKQVKDDIAVPQKKYADNDLPWIGDDNIKTLKGLLEKGNTMTMKGVREKYKVSKANAEILKGMGIN